jgi:hypothetical protein
MSDRRRADIVPLMVPRIIPDGHGAWFVVRGDHGWLYGSRTEAVRASRELLKETRP